MQTIELGKEYTLEWWEAGAGLCMAWNRDSSANTFFEPYPPHLPSPSLQEKTKQSCSTRSSSTTAWADLRLSERRKNHTAARYFSSTSDSARFAMASLCYTDFISFVSGFHLTALEPPMMPSMKPIMNPPPMIALGIENAIIMMPQALLFAGLPYSINEPSNTKAPHTSPIAVRPANGTASLDVPGIVGIIQGNQVDTTPRSNALIIIKIPAASEKVKALGFSLRLIIFVTLVSVFRLLCST
jgi:hypothetical protein